MAVHSNNAPRGDYINLSSIVARVSDLYSMRGFAIPRRRVAGPNSSSSSLGGRGHPVPFCLFINFSPNGRGFIILSQHLIFVLRCVKCLRIC